MNEDRAYLRFSDDAQEVFIEWLTDLQLNKLANEDDHPVIIEHLAKYRSLMPSLALIFHLIEAADKEVEPGPVSQHAAVMAAAWCEYLETHSRRIYSLAIDAGQAGAVRLAKKIKDGNIEQEFTRPDIVRKKWAMLTKKEDVQAAIDYLVDLSWLREKKIQEPANKTGRPAATVYEINPKIFSERTEIDAPKLLKPV